MWSSQKSLVIRTFVVSVVGMLCHATVNGQFYSLSFGTDESYNTAPVQAGAPSGPTQHQHEIRHKVTPLEAMIDKTNHLGFRVLHQHSKGNRNNIAFSPCSLASILVALYEGAAGNSAAELHGQLVAPYDKDVLRVGYRDIHRRLRSYFYQKENLLNGLSLSSENITIRPEYESVLKFYGYDLENIPEMRTPTTTTPMPATTLEMESEETTSDATTEMGNSTEPVELSTTVATMPDEPATGSTVDSVTTTEASQTTSDTGGDVDITTTMVSSEPAEEATTEATEETSEPPTTDVEEPVTEETGGEKRRRNLRKRGQRLLQRRHPDSPQRRRSVRQKRQPEEIDIISHQRFLQNFLLQDVTTNPSPALLATAGFPPAVDNTVRKNPFLQQPDAYRLLDDTIEHNFYLTETDIVKVPYKVYNTILKYAYIERLQSTVIELELDSEDYKLLIILPDYEFGLGNVLKLLQIGDNVPSLREVTEQMSPTWVKTIVPKFNLKGNIILTSDLQNLGINDIFEPSRADFSLMTEDPTIYAKHIEQSINVNIRTHSLQQLKRFTSLYKNPVELAVNYPFLFCILDNELDLALMVGRILNPLNARIH
uniref:Serpin domain-containing protein n=1 Tax=Anopheles coluzzii TaxID=1518534 RepID=A0A8W7PK16_ANOCL